MQVCFNSAIRHLPEVPKFHELTHFFFFFAKIAVTKFMGATSHNLHEWKAHRKQQYAIKYENDCTFDSEVERV